MGGAAAAPGRPRRIGRAPRTTRLTRPESSAEARLLSLAGLSPAERGRQLSSLSGESWRELARAAAYHGLGPLLWLDVRSADPSPALPPDVRRRLEELYVHSDLRNRSGRDQAAEVLAALRAADVEVIALKGLHLAATVYPDPAARPMQDHDVLVKPEDVQAASEALRGLGYRQDPAPRWLPGPGHHHERPFYRAGARPVELHHHLIPDAAPYGLDLAGVWSRSRQAIVSGVPARTLTPEDLLHHLVLHVALTHRFEVPLLMLRDIAATLFHYRTELDWDAFTRRAERDGTHAVVRATLSLVHGCTGAPVPPSLAESAQDDPVAAALRGYLLTPPWLDLPPALRSAPRRRMIPALLRTIVPPRAELARYYDTHASGWRILGLYLYRPFDLVRRRGRLMWRLVREMRTASERDLARRRVEEWLDGEGRGGGHT